MADAAKRKAANEAYFAERNRRIMAAGQESYDASGAVTTLRTATVGGENGEPAYIIPTYDPATKKVLDAKAAYAMAEPDIKAGKLQPYDTWQQAEADLKDFYPRAIRSHLPAGEMTTPIGRPVADGRDLETAFAEKQSTRKQSETDAWFNSLLAEDAAQKTVAEAPPADQQVPAEPTAAEERARQMEIYNQAAANFDAARADIEAGKNRAYPDWATAQAALAKLHPDNQESTWKKFVRNVSPLEAAGGVLDYADNAFETIRLLSNGGNEALMKAGVPALTFGPDGVGMTTDPAVLAKTKDLGDALPDIGDPTQAGFARSAGKFMAGYAVAGKMLGGVSKLKEIADSGRLGASAVAALKGAMSDFTGMRDLEGSLANLIQESPSLANPITEFLSAKDDSPELVNKLKTAIVGAGFGMAVDGIFAGLRAIRAGRTVEAGAKEVDQIAAGLQREADTHMSMLQETIGDPNDARLLIDSADSAAPAAAAASDSAAAPIFKDTRGNEIIHGSSSPVALTEGHYETMNIYGQGFYTTDAADVAAGYMKKGKGGNPSQYIVSPRSDAILYNLDQTMTPEVRATIEDLAQTDDAVSDALNNADEPVTTLRQVYDEIRAQSRGADRSADEVQGVFESIQARMEALGFSGYTHTGKGGPKKLAPHIVRIYFDPVRDVRLTQVAPDFFHQKPNLSAPVENAAGKVGDVFVNWARIDSEDDVKQVIQDLANRYSDSIDAARGGTKTFADTEAEAATEDAWKLLTERQQGQPLNASQTLAVRRLWTASGAKVADLARRVGAGGGVADQIALKKMIAVHATIQEQVIGIRTETARALSQWRIPAGESDQFMAGLQGLMTQMDVGADITKVAKGINRLADQGNLSAVDQFILGASKLDAMKKLGVNVSDAISQLYYMSLLSGPKTHVRNTMSNTAMLLGDVMSRRGAAYLGDLLGGQNVPDGEAAATLYGQLNGIMDAFRVAPAARAAAEADGLEMSLLQKFRATPFGTALTTGQGGMGVGKIEQPTEGAFSAAKWGMDPTSNAGRVMDWIDTATKSPMTAMGAEDEVFRTAVYQGQIHGLAFRQATNEAASGLISDGEIAQRAAEIARDPSQGLRLMAQAHAALTTFQNQPPPDSAVYNAMKWIGRIPVVGKLAMPFKRTPYNIAIEFGQWSPMAPLTRRWREDILAGGARGDIAWTKFLVGNASLIALADLAIKGGLVGADRGLGGNDQTQGETETSRLAGRRPMSFRRQSADGTVTSVGYPGLEPISTQIGLAANLVEILSSDQFDSDDKEIDDLVIAASAAIATQVTAPSFMSGLSDVMSFQSDPTRNAENFSERVAGSVVPNAIAEVARAQDPVIRDVSGWMDAIKAKTPGLSKTLPANTDRWGRDLTRDSGIGWAYDAISPFPVKRMKPEAIDLELDRLEVGLAKPQKNEFFDGVKINMKQHPHEYTRFVKLAGNALKATVEGDPITVPSIGYESEGGGLMDELNAIVTGKHAFSEIYNDPESTDGPDGDKAAFIGAIVNAFRNEAKVALLNEYPALRAKVLLKADSTPERGFARERKRDALDRSQ